MELEILFARERILGDCESQTGKVDGESGHLLSVL